MSKAPTVQQQAVYDAVEHGEANVAVVARAGAGKTTTAVGCVSRVRGRSAFVAFNKHIADELKSKLEGAAKACTMHSLGLAAVRRQFGPVEVDEGKPKGLLRQLCPDWFFSGRRGGIVARAPAKATLALTGHAKTCLAGGTDRAELTELAERFGVDLGDDQGDVEAVLDAVPRLLGECAEHTRTVDYDDMLWLPARLGLPVERFDLLVVDEAQDLSRCQQSLALRASENGRLVPIGDPKQAINGFAGADPEAFLRLTCLLGRRARGLAECPLTVTFRCPTSHVELARNLVPDIEAAPGAVAGEVLEVGEDSAAKHCSPGALVVSRRTAPLLSLAFTLIAANVPVMVRGRDVGRGLTDVIDQFATNDVAEFIQRLGDWKDREEEKLERKDASESAFQSLADRYGCLKELASGAATVAAMSAKVKALFDDTPDARKVVLSSVHRAKGLEAETVVVIDTGSLPLVLTCRACRGRGDTGGTTCPKCKGRGTRQRPWEVEQERNLLYVAVTRSRNKLVFAGGLPALLSGGW